MGAAILVTATVWAKKPWEQPFTEWNKKDAIKVLSDSPWADTHIRRRSFAGRGSGLRGEKEVFDTFIVRFFSALPIREAYVRVVQIDNDYDELNDAQRAAFDERFAPALNRDFGEEIMVSMDFQTNDQQQGLEMQRILRVNTVAFFRQSAFLISDRMGRVDLAGYYPPAPDGTGAKFIFPRQIDGQPVVSDDDKEVKFEINIPDFPRVLVTMKVKNMTYKGKLEI